ncbi:MAG TPA: amidohydrolase family protein [Pirellulales bacterium]|nr:amidohydrolase family protein [Pirellulales bacterium]
MSDRKVNISPSRREFMKAVGGTLALRVASVEQISRTCAASDPKRPIVDAHMHVWANDPQRYPFAHPYAKNYQGMPHEGTVEMLVEDMDRNACTHCVLVQTICHGWDNTYLADCVRRYPRRFKGHGLIDPTDLNVADTLEYWTKEQGLSGMRFSPMYYQRGNYGGDGWIVADHSHRLWRKAKQLGSIFNFFIASGQLRSLATMVAAHPEVRVIIDHLAQIDLGAANPEPDVLELLAMSKYPNVWVKVSELTSVSKSHEYPFPDAYPFVKRVYEAFGPERLLFGTGYPGSARSGYHRPPLRQEIDLVDKQMAFLTADDRDKILGRNAVRLWNFAV